MDMKISVCSIRLFLICVSLWLPAHSKKYVQRAGMRLLATVVTYEAQTASKMACVASCTSTSGCRSASWCQSLQLCLLSDQDVALMWPLDVIHPSLEADSGCETYGEIFYPVALFSWGRYTYTFAAARQVCQDRDLRLATQDQLLSARAMGLEMCSCGWFRDGTNGFILQQATWWCWGSFSTGILYCGYGSANAWCELH